MDSKDNERDGSDEPLETGRTQDDSKQCQYTYPCVIFCSNCEVLVSDSYSIVTSLPDLNILAFQGVTRHVIVDEKLHTSKDTCCNYHLLICNRCSTQIGKIYVSTSASLDYMRNLFLLDADNLISYQLGVPDRTIASDLKVISSHFMSVQFDKICTVLTHFDFKIKKMEKLLAASKPKEIIDDKIERLDIADIFREASNSQESEFHPKTKDYENGIGLNDSEHENQHRQVMVNLIEKTKLDDRVEPPHMMSEVSVELNSADQKNDDNSKVISEHHPELKNLLVLISEIEESKEYNSPTKLKHDKSKVKDPLDKDSGSEYSPTLRSKHSAKIKICDPEMKDRLSSNSGSEDYNSPVKLKHDQSKVKDRLAMDSRIEESKHRKWLRSKPSPDFKKRDHNPKERFASNSGKISSNSGSEDYNTPVKLKRDRSKVKDGLDELSPITRSKRSYKPNDRQDLKSETFHKNEYVKSVNSQPTESSKRFKKKKYRTGS